MMFAALQQMNLPAAELKAIRAQIDSHLKKADMRLCPSCCGRLLFWGAQAGKHRVQIVSNASGQPGRILLSRWKEKTLDISQPHASPHFVGLRRMAFG